MRLARVCIRVPLVKGYSSGPGSCFGPDHSSGISTSIEGLSIVYDTNTNRIVLESTTPFKGFLVKTNADLDWSVPSSGADMSGVCGHAKALGHIDSSLKSVVSGRVNCENQLGRNFVVTAFVVFDYSSPYREIESEVFTCTGTTTLEPTVESTDTPSLNFDA